MSGLPEKKDEKMMRLFIKSIAEKLPFNDYFNAANSLVNFEPIGEMKLIIRKSSKSLLIIFFNIHFGAASFNFQKIARLENSEFLLLAAAAVPDL